LPRLPAAHVCLEASVSPAGIAAPLIRLALRAIHLLPQGEKGVRGLSTPAHPSPLVGLRGGGAGADRPGGAMGVEEGPRGEKGSPRPIGSIAPSPLEGEGLGVRGARCCHARRWCACLEVSVSAAGIAHPSSVSGLRPDPRSSFKSLPERFALRDIPQSLKGRRGSPWLVGSIALLSPRGTSRRWRGYRR